MKSFFKKETKEDKERKRLEKKKNGELSFNNTLSPDVYESGDVSEVPADSQSFFEISKTDSGDSLSQYTSTSKTLPVKLQSNSKSSIDSQQQSLHPPILPKPKKGILKTMSKFGIGPTLSNFSGSSNNNTVNNNQTANQQHVLINSSTNAPIVSSPKQQTKSPQNKMINSIENSVTNYSKRNSQVIGHNLMRTPSKGDVDNFLLPSVRKLPEFSDTKESNENNWKLSNALIRCVDVPIDKINHINLRESNNGSILIICDHSKLQFLPGDELVSLRDQLVSNKQINEIKQILNTLQNDAMSENKKEVLPVYVKTSLEFSELIVRNTCDGMSKIQHADSSNLNLMNSSLAKETTTGQLVSSSTSLLIENESESAWLIHTKGYSLVKIISKIKNTGKLDTDAVKFKIRLENGNMIEVNEENLEKINPSKYDYCEDLSQLQFINESSLIHTLRQRYVALKLKHSYIGSSSLLVLSPKLTKELSSQRDTLYSDSLVSVFKGCKFEEMPPHIYSYTQNVYRNMFSTRQDQSIVLVGHSGSAKTTNAKHILNYLFKITPQLTSNSNNNFTESKIEAMFCLLNAFCSVLTDKNQNGANRFINIFLMEFNHSGQIASILLQFISLDQTRLLYQPNTESNFLIFYYLLFGCDETSKANLQLDDFQLKTQGNEKNHLFNSNFDTKELENRAKCELEKVTSAFQDLGIKETEVKTIFSILSAIMILGNTGAIPTQANSRFGQFNRPNEAHKVASLLGVSFQQLNDSVFCSLPSNQSSQNIHTKYGHLSNNGSSRVSPDSDLIHNLTPTECLEGFCLGLYQEVLNMLTNLINRSFKSSSNNGFHHQQSISNSMLIIDPPGFQHQQNGGKETASYSDLMCNYLSERLQLMFYQINFINPIEKCAQEGLDIDLVEHIPESPSQLVNWFDKPVAPAILNRTVNTITNGHLKSPVNIAGLLWLLEEQISNPQKSASIFMKKLIDSDQKQNFISIKNIEASRNFTIHHQFGQFPVEYNVSEWLEQYCKEYTTQSNAAVLLNESKKEYISASIKNSVELSNQNNLSIQNSLDPSKPAFSLKRQASVRKMLTMSKRKTFNVNFKLQLDSVFDSMRRTKCNFVFCLQPAIKASSSISECYNNLNVNFLRSQLKAYQILAASRIYRQGYPDSLNLEDFERRFSMFLPNNHTELALQTESSIQDNHKKNCLLLINNLELDSSLFKFGISQIFFKAGVLNKLEDQRDKRLNNLIVKLQSNCRRYLAQKAIEKKKVQNSAIRCIQKNIRISFLLKKWKWWKLYTNLMPIINVQNTETLFKQCKEELDECKRKNERLVNEKNNLQVLNHQLENKFMTLQSEYIEEHTANSGTVELLEAETAERLRLDTELNELKSLHNETSKKLESSETEILELRLISTKQQIQDQLHDESSNKELDMLTVIQIDKLKRENDNLQKQLTQEKENENIYKQKERSFFENKLKDKDNDILEAEKQSAASKRKYQKLCEEMQDIQRMCDGLKVRNNELEKVQRKFDNEMNNLKSKYEVEKELREKCERDRDVLKYEVQNLNDKFESEKMERTYMSEKCVRLEHDLKEYESTKFESLNSTSNQSSNADQFIKMKNQIRDMEAKINDQEEELDDQQGTIQQLEQTKLRLQMQAEKEKSKWQREIAEKESEMDDLRFHTQKKIKSIEMQLEEESEISSSLQREKRELERKIKEFSAIGKRSNFMLTINSNGDINGSDLIMNNGSSIGDYISKLKRQMQKYKMLAIDAQTQLEKIGENIPKQSILKALKSQLEDSEISKANALKAKQMLMCEVNELQTELEEGVLLRQSLEEQNMHLNREIINLKSQLEDQERDTDDLLKKLQSQIQSNSLDSNHFIELNNQIDIITIENRMLKEKIREHEEKICVFENGWVEKTVLNKIESKSRDLECKLELESTQKNRLQNQLERVRQQYEKALGQNENILAREKKIEDTLKKSQRQNKEAIDEFGDVQKKIIDLEETKKRLEQQNEILEKELDSAKNENKVNLTRLDAFQNAFNSMNDEIDSDEETEDNYDFDEDEDDYNDHNISLTCE